MKIEIVKYKHRLMHLSINGEVAARFHECYLDDDESIGRLIKNAYNSIKELDTKHYDLIQRQYKKYIDLHSMINFNVLRGNLIRFEFIYFGKGWLIENNPEYFYHNFEKIKMDMDKVIEGVNKN